MDWVGGYQDGGIQGCLSIYLAEQVEEELAALGLSAEASSGIIGATRVGSLAELEGLLGAGNEAVLELHQLFSLAEGYGYADYLQLDTSCVRGLAYYTGAPGITKCNPYP